VAAKADVKLLEAKAKTVVASVEADVKKL